MSENLTELHRKRYDALARLDLQTVQAQRDLETVADAYDVALRAEQSLKARRANRDTRGVVGGSCSYMPQI